MNENLNVVDARYEGRTEGIAIGEKNAMRRTIKRLHKLGISEQMIFESILEDYGDKLSRDEFIKIFKETK